MDKSSKVLASPVMSNIRNLTGNNSIRHRKPSTPRTRSKYFKDFQTPRASQVADLVKVPKACGLESSGGLYIIGLK